MLSKGSSIILPHDSKFFFPKFQVLIIMDYATNGYNRLDDYALISD